MLRIIWAVPWAVAVFVSANAARATEITGHHDSQMYDGYDITSGSYDVAADSGGVPSATFNGNGGDGLRARGSSTSVSIEGGQFNNNFVSGVESGLGATITVNGGVFDNNDEAITAGQSSVINIFGGQFFNDADAVFAGSGMINLYGGQFSGSKSDDLSNLGGTFNVYGAFANVADGQTITLTGDGSFYGQLEDNSTPQIYTYFNGPITLHGTSTFVPEPIWIGVTVVFGATTLSRRLRSS